MSYATSLLETKPNECIVGEMHAYKGAELEGAIDGDHGRANNHPQIAVATRLLVVRAAMTEERRGRRSDPSCNQPRQREHQFDVGGTAVQETENVKLKHGNKRDKKGQSALRVHTCDPIRAAAPIRVLPASCHLNSYCFC